MTLINAIGIVAEMFRCTSHACHSYSDRTSALNFPLNLWCMFPLHPAFHWYVLPFARGCWGILINTATSLYFFSCPRNSFVLDVAGNRAGGGRGMTEPRDDVWFVRDSIRGLDSMHSLNFIELLLHVCVGRIFVQVQEEEEWNYCRQPSIKIGL